MSRNWKSAEPGLAALSFAFLLTAPLAGDSLTINPIFDESVTLEQKTAVENTISFYGSTFSNSITVNIEFVTLGTDAVAENKAALYYSPIATVLNMLKSDSTANSGNTVLASALNFFAKGNTAPQMQETSADCRALGGNCPGKLNGTGSVTRSDLDGIVTLGSERYDTQDILHEINEVLGMGGWSTILGENQVVNGMNTIGMLDPYRYSAAGTPSLTTDTTARSYFSLDGGVTDIANFNQSGFGDYGDLTTATCYVQSYMPCSPVMSETLTSPEGLGLQAVGYNAAVSKSGAPEPGNWSLMILGLCGLAAAVRRSRGCCSGVTKLAGSAGATGPRGVRGDSHS